VRGNYEIKAMSAFGSGQLPLPESTVTVAQILKSAGYATACTGKWGMGQFDTTGSPLKKGFDHFFGYNGQVQAHEYFPPELYLNDQRIELPENKGSAKKTYAPDLILKDTLDWVRAHKDGPFFLCDATTLPHGNFEINDLGEYANREGWTQQQKTYAAMVSRLDRDVGALFALLKALKIDQNTLVIFAGDNGSSFEPNTPVGKLFDQSMGGTLRGFKSTMYEGGLRQAAIARWPGVIPAGRVSDEPWAFWDFLPTAAELAETKIPANCKPDGLSLVSFLKGGASPKREYFYWELHAGQPLTAMQAIRFSDWKAVKNGPNAPMELYNLREDSSEKNNVAAGHPDLVLKAKTLMQQARVDDPNWPMQPRPKQKQP
jgi:arylsulfatase A-like enzyme